MAASNVNRPAPRVAPPPESFSRSPALSGRAWIDQWRARGGTIGASRLADGGIQVVVCYPSPPSIDTGSLLLAYNEGPIARDVLAELIGEGVLDGRWH